MVAVEVRGELLDVGVVVAGLLCGVDAAARVDHQRILGAHDRRAEQSDEADGHHRGERPLDRDRLDREVDRLVDAEQHDHEQEQHDDRAGVHDHLHRGEEVGLHRDELDGDAEQREHQTRAQRAPGSSA